MVAWVPVHAAAAAMVDFLDSDEELVHLVHPHPVPWTEIFQHMSDLLKVPLVPFPEWFSRLEDVRKTSAESEVELVKRVPALKLSDMFRGAAKAQTKGDVKDAQDSATEGKRAGGEEGLYMPALSVDRALKVSQTLASPNLGTLNADEVRKWLEYWQLL